VDILSYKLISKRLLLLAIAIMLLFEIALIASLFGPIYSTTKIVSYAHKVHEYGGTENLESLIKEVNRIAMIKIGIRFSLIVGIIINFIIISKIIVKLKRESNRCAK